MLALLLQATAPGPSITLAEAGGMSPSALADRLLPGQPHGPMIDAVINGLGALTPPSSSVQEVLLTERMVPFDATFCRSHRYMIALESSDPAANLWVQSVPTRPVRVEQFDRLWMPPTGPATVENCAAAPARTWGFAAVGLDLDQAAALVGQARTAFQAPGRAFTVSCEGERGACGPDPRETLASIRWGSLGSVEAGKTYGQVHGGGSRGSNDALWGPAFVQFIFPLAANGATWVITVERAPQIVTVRMKALMIYYH